MLPVIQLGPAALPTRPLMLLVALYAGLWLAGREATRRGFDGDAIWNAGFLGAVAGLIGGRLAYALQHWSAYRQDPGAIFSLTPGTIAPLPALAIGALIAMVYLTKIRLWRVEILDSMAPGVALALALISLGNFLSGDAFGAVTDVPWAVSLWDERRHPVQIYEMLAWLALCAALWAGRHRARPGQPIWTLILGFGLIRLLFEPFRAESWLWPGGYRGYQVIGLVAALVALWVLTSPATRSVSENAPRSHQDANEGVY